MSQTKKNATHIDSVGYVSPGQSTANASVRLSLLLIVVGGFPRLVVLVGLEVLVGVLLMLVLVGLEVLV